MIAQDIDQIYIVIRNLILNIIDENYLPANIVQGFQAPVADNFVTFVVLDHDKQFMRGVTSYTEDLADETITNNQLESLPIQIDFWSDKQYTSQANAYNLHNYLGSFAQEYLNDNYFGFGIGEINSVQNITAAEDKGKYLYRYCLRFSLFAQNVITVPQIFTSEVQPFLEYQQ